MEVILLERVAKLGQMGDVVRVKDGFARNFLLPRGKALRATEENRTRFETHENRARGPLADAQDRSGRRRREAQWQELHGPAPSLGSRPAVRLGVAARPRRPHRQLGFAVNRNQIALNTPIKTIGQHNVPISLHPEIETIDHRDRRPQ